MVGDNHTTISISEFKAKCTERLRAVEEHGLTLQITRHGKVVATVTPPRANEPTMADWIGSGAGMMAPDASALFDGPSWEPGDWAMEKDSEL